MDPTTLLLSTGVLRLVKTLPSILDFFQSQSPVRKSGGDFLLRDRKDRAAIGIRKVNNQLVPTLFLESAEGSAYEEAQKTSADTRADVLVEVLGTAHSAQPSTKSTIDNEELRPGISVCHEDGYAGSLGAFVNFRYRRNSAVYKGFTSSSHVLGYDGAEQGSHIVSPGRPDKSPDIDDRIGKLARSIRLTHYTTQNAPDAIVNLTDIGVAQLSLPLIDQVSNRVPDPTGSNKTIPLRNPMTADELVSHLEKPVFMFGRSGMNLGILHATGVQPCPLKIGNRIYLYGNVGLIRPPKNSRSPFSQPGDSGAPVYAEDGRLIGFHVGGAQEKGLFHPAHQCLAAMDARLL